jgi:hypothetical protein
MIGTAELRRRFGFGIAWTVATANEIFASHTEGQRPDIRAMDDANNAIGLEIGRTARSYEDVVRRARAAIDAAIAERGTGAGGTAVWVGLGREPQRVLRPSALRTLPVTWPDDIPSAAAYPYGAEWFRFDRGEATPREREAAMLARLEPTPVTEWSEEDVRAVIRSRPYQNGSVAGSTTWRERVRQYFAARDGAAGDDTCGGPAAVRAHTRQTARGPVTVAAHTRMVTCD